MNTEDKVGKKKFNLKMTCIEEIDNNNDTIDFSNITGKCLVKYNENFEEEKISVIYDGPCMIDFGAKHGKKPIIFVKKPKIAMGNE